MYISKPSPLNRVQNIQTTASKSYPRKLKVFLSVESLNSPIPTLHRSFLTRGTMVNNSKNRREKKEKNFITIITTVLSIGFVTMFIVFIYRMSYI